MIEVGGCPVGLAGRVPAVALAAPAGPVGRRGYRRHG